MTHTASPLEEWMRQAQAGDKKAYANLLRAISPILKGFIARRIGFTAEADDLLQEMLISVHRAAHTYDSTRPFKAWLFAIARHRLNDYFRSVYKNKDFPEISLDEISFEIALPNVTGGGDNREYLFELLQTLPEKQQKIVTLMKLEEKSAEETAKLMGMSLSAVKVAAHRAYKALASAAAKKPEDA